MIPLSIFFLLLYRFPLGNCWDFQNNLWGPAYLLLNNQNPYDINILFPHSNAIWFPPAILSFLFLGLFPFKTACTLWLLLNLVAFIFTGLIMTSLKKSYGGLMWIVLLAVFPSTISNFTLGQFSILSLLLMLWIARKYPSLPIWVSGIVISILCTKPQLISLAFPVFLFKIFQEKGIKAALHHLAWILSGILFSAVTLFFFSPGWFSQLIENLQDNPMWSQPNLNSLMLQRSFHSPLIPLILIMIGIGLSWWYSSKHDMYNSIILSMALTPIFSPYIWSWDFVLVYPLLITSYLNSPKKAGKIGILSGYILITTLYISLMASGYTSDEFYYWVVPLLLLVIIMNKLYNFWSITSSPASTIKR